MNEQVIETLTYALIIGVVSGSMYLMKKMAAKKIEVNEDGQYHLKLPLFYGIIGAMGLFFGLFWIALPFILHYTGEVLDVTMLIAFPILGFIFSLLGVFLLLYYKNHRVVFDQKI